MPNWLITTCKNRTKQLRTTLPGWVNCFRGEWNIIVIGDEEAKGVWLSGDGHAGFGDIPPKGPFSRVKCWKTITQKTRVIGDKDRVVFVDVDFVATLGAAIEFESIQVDQGEIGVASMNEAVDERGTFVCLGRDAKLALNSVTDEEAESVGGYGCDDLLLRALVVQAMRSRGQEPAWRVMPVKWARIRHGDHERTREYGPGSALEQAHRVHEASVWILDRISKGHGERLLQEVRVI